MKDGNELLSALTPEERREAEILARAMIAVMDLAELREARGITQTDMAGRLGLSQPRVSQIEHGEDLQLSTLNRYVSQLGGRLHIEAVFSDDQVVDLSLPSANATS